MTAFLRAGLVLKSVFLVSVLLGHADAAFAVWGLHILFGFFPPSFSVCNRSCTGYFAAFGHLSIPSLHIS